jgi:hypothetical protein
VEQVFGESARRVERHHHLGELDLGEHPEHEALEAFH